MAETAVRTAAQNTPTKKKKSVGYIQPQQLISTRNTVSGSVIERNNIEICALGEEEVQEFQVKVGFMGPCAFCIRPRSHCCFERLICS